MPTRRTLTLKTFSSETSSYSRPPYVLGYFGLIVIQLICYHRKPVVAHTVLMVGSTLTRATLAMSKSSLLLRRRRSRRALPHPTLSLALTDGKWPGSVLRLPVRKCRHAYRRCTDVACHMSMFSAIMYMSILCISSCSSGTSNRRSPRSSNSFCKFTSRNGSRHEVIYSRLRLHDCCLRYNVGNGGYDLEYEYDDERVVCSFRTEDIMLK